MNVNVHKYSLNIKIYGKNILKLNIEKRLWKVFGNKEWFF